MMISNEQLSAYIDGELEPAEMERVRTAVQSDELLAARLRKFEQVDSALAAFAGGIDEAPVPRALRERLGLDEPTLAQAPARAARDWRLGLALAASVLVVVFAGLRLQPPGRAATDFDMLAQVGPIPAANPLAHALERLPSASTELAEGAVRITPQLSFVSAAGGVCREFRLDGEGRAARGVACRGEAGWQTLRVAAATAQGGAAGQFETAAGDADAEFDAFVDTLLAGVPLDPQDEAKLMQQGWRTP